MPRQLQSDPPLRWELGLLARQKHSPADPAATGPAGIEPAILRRTRAAKKWEGTMDLRAKQGPRALLSAGAQTYELRAYNLPGRFQPGRPQETTLDRTTRVF